MATAHATHRYIEGIGRRKEAIARVRVTFGGTKGSFIVNEKPLAVYFPLAEYQHIVQEALVKAGEKHPVVTVQVKGGGVRAQAEAVRLGTARALIVHDKDLRAMLKPLGFLRRDARRVERKKFGLKKARKSPQWAKR
ncbi:MAG: 30S ribosomal protein S9 [Patescibacteria group bacterium]